MLVRNITTKIDIPHEADQFVVFRRLTWKQLQKARDVVGDRALEKMRVMGGEIYKAMQDAQDTPETLAKKATDPLRGYDVETLLGWGIASWSYPDDPNAENKDALDEKTAKWAGVEILKFSDAIDDKAAQKNG